MKRNKREKKERRTRDRKRRPLFQMEGIVRMTREGYCFVDDVFVKASKTRGALNGDRVVVDVLKYKASDTGSGGSAPKSERAEGVITQIVERSRTPFVGFLHIVGNRAWVLMQSKVMPYDIAISDIPKTARQGYKVAAVVDDWPRGESNPTGHIVDVLGAPGENDTEMHAILAEYGLPYRFEAFVEKAAGKISAEITPTDIKERKDFRKTLTFTIDPSDAKDFDDAISFKQLKNGHVEAGVHIADVTHYVTEGTVIDKEARQRGTSVYLADRTVPMLPEKLSNNLCSLRPGEDKLTFSAVFELDDDAKIVSEWFGPTVIRSDRRLDYDGAQAIILKDKAADKVEEAVRRMWSLAEKLRKARFASGAISFERPEMKVVCDEKGKPVDVVRKISVEANWLIEEFMLLANRRVAEYVAVQCHDSTFVYRVHDEPDVEKLSTFRTFVKNFGYKLAPDLKGAKVSEEFNGLFRKVKDRNEASAIELMALRCMAKAKYDVVNIGHYGLAFRYYTHFTSPIRRYPDMMVHRLLKRYLSGGASTDKDLYAQECKYASDREQVAADAERASIKYKMVEYMQDKVGDVFDGHVSGLTEWGIYVEIEPTHIEGMVPLRDIKSDYFYFDEEHYRVRGRHTRRAYTVGTPVKVRVARADLDQKQLDFELFEENVGINSEK